jgi:hypothetical protein
MPEPKEEMTKETLKTHYDLFKHLTTLDTGAIVILATFLTKLNPNTPNNPMVNYSVIFLAVSLLCCIGGMYAITMDMDKKSNASIPFVPTYTSFGRSTSLWFIFSVLFFFIGIVFLTVFIVFR